MPRFDNVCLKNTLPRRWHLRYLSGYPEAPDDFNPLTRPMPGRL